uniref:Uncharacterized protein n=1 Tax=Arundo donax TaxID=35708 RepID=A0A0A9AIQ7_ARUDO
MTLLPTCNSIHVGFRRAQRPRVHEMTTPLAPGSFPESSK